MTTPLSDRNYVYDNNDNVVYVGPPRPEPKIDTYQYGTRTLNIPTRESIQSVLVCPHCGVMVSRVGREDPTRYPCTECYRVENFFKDKYPDLYDMDVMRFSDLIRDNSLAEAREYLVDWESRAGERKKEQEADIWVDLESLDLRPEGEPCYVSECEWNDEIGGCDHSVDGPDEYKWQDVENQLYDHNSECEYGEDTCEICVAYSTH